MLLDRRTFLMALAAPLAATPLAWVLPFPEIYHQLPPTPSNKHVHPASPLPVTSAATAVMVMDDDLSNNCLVQDLALVYDEHPRQVTVSMRMLVGLTPLVTNFVTRYSDITNCKDNKLVFIFTEDGQPRDVTLTNVVLTHHGVSVVCEERQIFMVMSDVGLLAVAVG